MVIIAESSVLVGFRFNGEATRTIDAVSSTRCTPEFLCSLLEVIVDEVIILDGIDGASAEIGLDGIAILLLGLGGGLLGGTTTTSFGGSHVVVIGAVVVGGSSFLALDGNGSGIFHVALLKLTTQLVVLLAVILLEKVCAGE